MSAAKFINRHKKEEKKIDFESFFRQASEQLRSGKPFTGADGVFTPFLKQIPGASLEGEPDSHPEDTRKTSGNSRNGLTRKNIQSSSVGFEIFSPRDRNASFEPQTVSMRQRVISEETKK